MTNNIERHCEWIAYHASNLAQITNALEGTGAFTMTDFELAIAEREIDKARDSIKSIVAARKALNVPKERVAA